MKILFDPAIGLLNRLKYPQKFILISLLFILPLALAMTLLILKIDEKIAFGQKELDGDAYLRPLRQLLEHAPQSRRLAHEYLAGNSALKDQLLAKYSQIDNDFAALTAIDQQLGPELQTAAPLAALKEGWQELKGEGLSLAPPASDEHYTKLIAEIRSLIAHVGDTSNLILDPDLDSYYLMDAVLLKLPETADLIGQIQSLGEAVISQQTLSAEDRARLLITAGLIQTNSAATKNGMAIAFRNNPSGAIQPALEQPLQLHASATEKLVQTIDRQIVNAQSPALAPSQYSAEAEAALDTTFRLWDRSAAQLDQLLQARIGGAAREKQLVVVFAVLVLLFVTYLLVAFYLAVMRTVGSLDAAAKRMLSGQTNGVVPLNTSDELGQVVRSFNEIATALVAEGTQRQAAEAERAQLQEEIIRRQTEALAELSAPLIPISDQIVVMPLIGTIDPQRIGQITVALLHGVAERRARIVILDITGVPTADAQTAEGLLQVARAVRLLGAQTMITGMRAEVALALANSGADMSGIVTHGSLQSGISYAAGRNGAVADNI